MYINNFIFVIDKNDYKYKRYIQYMVILNQIPDLKTFMEKEVLVVTKFGYKCKGLMRGFDHFLNIILEIKMETDNNKFSEIVMLRGSWVVTISLT